jgi:hypothetical protein
MQNISCILPMGQNAYVSFGLQNFCRQNATFFLETMCAFCLRAPGLRVILPTKKGKFTHPGMICFRQIS